MPRCKPPIFLTLLPCAVLSWPLSLPGAEFPWKLDRPYRFDWFEKKQKTGEIRFQFSKVREADSTLFRLTSRRRIEKHKQGESCSGELYFQQNSIPVRYSEELTFTQLGRVSGSQEVKIRFTGRRVECTHINNGKVEKATRHRLEVEPETFLFGTYALEHWTVFALKLKERRKHTLKLFYPQFAKVGTVTFVPEKKDVILEIGGKKVPVRRYRFEDKSMKFRGSVWIDEMGRLLQYTSGILKLVLKG